MGITRTRAGIRGYRTIKIYKSFHIKIIVKQGNRFYANT